MSDYTGGYIPDQAATGGYIPEDKGILDYVNPFDDIKGLQSIDTSASQGDPIQDSLNKMAQAPASGVAKTAPTFFDYDGNNTDRYKSSAYYKELGFDPGVDNETKYGNRQTWGNAIGNALGGGAGLAYQTFKSGWAGWGDMAKALFSWDSSKLTGTPEELANINQTQNDIMNKYAIFSTPESEQSVFNRQFFANMLQQGGFAIGTTAQFLSEELLTLGTSTEASLAKLGISTAKFAGRAAELGEVTADAKRLGDIWKVDNIANNIWKTAKRLVPMSETADELIKASKAGAGALQLGLIGVGGVKRALAEANMAFTEARMEASGTYGDLTKKLTQEYIDKNGQAPVGDDFNKIQNAAYSAGTENFNVNSGILLLANRIEFENMFNKFSTSRKILKDLGEYSEDVLKITGPKAGIEGAEQLTKVYDKGYFGAIGNYKSIASDFGTKRAAWEVAKTASHGLMHWEIPEGVQEVLQDLSNNTMQNYYYDMYHGVKGYSYGKSFDKAQEQERQGTTGLQTFLMGALTGALLSPFTFGVEKGTERFRVGKQALDEQKIDKATTISTLNAFYSDPKNFLKEEISSFKVHDAASQSMEDALKNSDEYTYNNSRDSSLAKVVTAAKKTDMLESVLDTIRGFGDHIKTEEFKDAFGIDPTEENIENTKQYAHNIADRIEQFSKDYEHLNDKYGDLVMPELFPEGSSASFQAKVAKHALGDALEVLATNRFKSERATERAVSVLNEVAKNKAVGQSAAVSFPILSSHIETSKQISILTDEIKLIEDNPKKTPDINQQLSQKKTQLDALTKWREGWIFESKAKEGEDNKSSIKRSSDAVDAEKAKEAYKQYINSKNEENRKSTAIAEDDVNETFKNFQDYTDLNADHKEYIDAYNTLANPRNFVVYHGKMMDAIKTIRDQFYQEHLEELGLNTEDTKNKTTITSVDPEDPEKTVESEIVEGNQYVTTADPDSVWYNNKAAKTFNNDLIDILKIDGDKITVRVNNDKSYIVTAEQLGKKGKLFDLSKMTPDERIYFKNRDQVLPINVNTKTGKLHAINGKYAQRDYSKGGTQVKARLVLVKEDGVNVLKLQYKNPITGKIQTVNYNREYLIKYGDGKINLRTFPKEAEEQERLKNERVQRNFEKQSNIFSQRLSDAETQLQQAQVNKEVNQQRFDELSKTLDDNKALLELVQEELSKFQDKPGRKPKARVQLEKMSLELNNTINESADQIENLKKEKENLDNTIEALKQAKDFYEDASLELMDTEQPYDRNGNENLSTSTQEELDNKSSNQITSRTSSQRVDELIEDTQNEIDGLNGKINKLSDYIKIVKDTLSNITNLKDFLDFLDLPESVQRNKTLRSFLRNKIAEATDPEQKEKYQSMIKSVLSSYKTGSDILFLLSSLRDSVNELNKAQDELKSTQEKFDRLAQAQAEKRDISTLQDRVEFLNQVQKALTEDAGKVFQEKSAPEDSNDKVEDQDHLQSDTVIVSGTDTDTYRDKKPKFEEVGFNKTFGRQYLDENDEVPNTEDGTDRFFAFTAKQNVMGQGYELQVMTEHFDPLDIRQPSINPNDVKLVLVKKNKDGEYEAIDKDGKVIETPTGDNVVYRSMADINNLSVERVRNDYTVHESTTDEQIQKAIDEHIAYQKDLVNKTKSGPVYLQATSTSPGVQRVQRNADNTIAKAETEGRVIEDNPDFSDLKSANNPEVHIALRVETAKGGGSTAPGILPGRAVLQEYTIDPENGRKIWGDKATRVFNRELTEEEKTKLVSILARFADLFNKKTSKAKTSGTTSFADAFNKRETEVTTGLDEKEQAEFDLISNYIKNILPWGDGRSNRFFYVSNGLHLGITTERQEAKVIPFTSTSINKEAKSIFAGVYHHINNKSLQNNEEFEDVKVNKDGKVEPGKTYKTYTEYLLTKREGQEIPPVYTSLPRVNSETPQRTNSYLNWVDPNVEPNKIATPERAKVEVAPVVEQAPAPTQQTTKSVDEQIDDFVNYNSKSLNIKGVEFSYKASGTGVYLEVKNGDQIKKSPVYASKEEIIKNQAEIKKNIYDAAGLNPKLSGLRNLGATKALEDKTFKLTPEEAVSITKKEDLPQKTDKNTGVLERKVQTTESQKDSDGTPMFFSTEEARDNVKPKDGRLSAHVFEKNAITNETRQVASASIKINHEEGQSTSDALRIARAQLYEALNKQLATASDEEAPFRLALEEFKQTEDFKALESFMKENLPQFPVNKVGELIHGKAWGAFMKGALYIYNNAEIGTGFHEAFEGVWTSYLNDKEKEDLIKEFQSKKGQFTNPFTKETKDYSEATPYDAREMMAEDFRDYVLNGRLDGDKLKKNFFQKVWDFIRNLFNLSPKDKENLTSGINQLFKKIGTGGFKELTPVRELSQEVPVYRAVGSLSQQETADTVEGLGYYFFLELYKNGSNIDSLLSGMDPKQSNELLNKLYNAAHAQVLENTKSISQRVYSEIDTKKNELYNEFKKSIARYGLDTDEVDGLQTKEENTVNGLGIRDSISIDPNKMTAVNVKLLIASLPQSEYNKEGKLLVTRNNLNQPRLVDYNKTQNLMLNELSNIVSTYDENGNHQSILNSMFTKLDNKYKLPSGNYKPGYTWIKNLKLRIKFEDITGVPVPIESLSLDDMMVRIAFTKSFTNVKTIPQKTIVGTEGYIYNLNPTDNINVDRVRDNWSNNLKNTINSGTGFISLDPTGVMIINRSADTYRKIINKLDKRSSIDLKSSLEILNSLGINFTASQNEIEKHSNTLKAEAIHILEQIKAGTINTIAELYGNSIIGGRINNLLAIEARFTGEDNILSYRNADGEAQYSVGIPSLLSNVINTLNSVKSQKELINTFPWLGTINKKGVVTLNNYQLNSELIKLDGVLFDGKGNRREGANVTYQIISGMGTSDYEGTSTDDLQYPERLANKIHYLLDNTVFSNINSDKSTEFGIGIPGNPLATVGDVNKLLFFSDSPIINKYINHLADEMAAAVYNKKSPSNIQYYKDQVESLGHFRDILGKELVDKFKKDVISSTAKFTGDFAHENFIEANRDAIEDKINKHLLDQIEKTVAELKVLDLFTRPNFAGNDLYITNAIDNDKLKETLKVQGSQTITNGTGDEAQTRQGFSEKDLKVLAGFLVSNEELLIAEQHKLIYGHPALYKDLPKRANGSTSTKEQMDDNPDTLKWMDNSMPRNDGKIRSSENHPMIRLISYKDQNVVSPVYNEIAEGFYAEMSKTETNKSLLEQKIGAKFDDKGNLTGLILDKNKNTTGAIKNYLALVESDAMAWGMPDAIRDMLFRTGKLSKEQAKQFDYEMAYEKIALSKNDKYNNYSKEELDAAQKILNQGDPGEVFPVLKPQYFGYQDTDGVTHTVFLKHAVQPRFFRHIEGTAFEKLYLAAKKNQVDIIGFESGQKVGNVVDKNGEFTDIYNSNGEINIRDIKNGYDLPTSIPQQNLYSKFYGIQVEMAPKSKSTVVRGTQVSKLIMLNYFENGKAISEKVGNLVKEYNNTLENMMSLGKENLLKELGLTIDKDGNYETENLTSLVDTLRKEAQNRDLPDNMIEGINSIKNQDGTQSLKYKFDTLINREKIDNILNSIVDSRVISEKINGKPAVQVASTLYESSPRQFMYLKDGKYVQLSKKDIKTLTPEEKASIKMQSSDLKFYTNKNGKIQSMEVYITWPYKNISPEQMGLKLSNGIYKLEDNSSIDKRLLESLGFRIPTQAMNSIESVKIKGFTPITNGDMVVVPSEMVGKGGSDFDIDKLNMYLANHFYNSNTKQLEYIEYKGSVQATKDHYSDLFDKGELLDKKQSAELKQYIKDSLELTSNKTELDTAANKLLKSIFTNFFSDDQFTTQNLTSEFLADITADDENLKTRVVNAMVKKALQNHYISLMGQLVQEPSNYSQLLTPNTTDTIKNIATQITQWKVDAGSKTAQDEKSFTYLRSFIGGNQIRERYLTAKRMVGIAAIHGTFHSLAQVAGVKLEGTFLTKSIYFLIGKGEDLRTINIKLDHNSKQEDSTFNIGLKTDDKGNSISDTISQKLSGFVDGAKDPFVFDLNLNMNTASTSFYLDHHGVDPDQQFYFLNQPILDKYFAEFAKNRTGFKKINDGRLNGEKLFFKVVDPYFKAITGKSIVDTLATMEANGVKKKGINQRKASFVAELNSINHDIENFSSEDMINAIKSGDKADPKLQVAVLMNYLEYTAQSQLLNNYIRAIGYDNKKTKTIQENEIQVATWAKSKAEKFIANPESILDKTFIGNMKAQKEDIFNMFKNYFVTLSPEVQKVFQPLEEKIANPDYFASKNDQTLLLSRYQNFVLSYILHTTEFQDSDMGKITLNNLYKEMLQGDDSMAKLLSKYKKSGDPNIKNNLIIQELLPIINDDVNKTDNISLFRNKIDTFKTNNLIEALDNLRSYAQQTADSKLETFVNNLAKFSLIQSGMQASNIDYRKVLSTGVYSDMVNNILSGFNKELSTPDVWRAFHQNNWNNSSVVPKAPSWAKLKSGRLTIGDGFSLSNNDYLLKTVKKAGITKEQFNEMKRNKTLNNAFDYILLEKKFLDEKDNWVYEPINKYGDGPRFTEIPGEEEPSVLSKNGDVSKQFDGTGTQSTKSQTGWISYKDLYPEENQDPDQTVNVNDTQPVNDEGEITSDQTPSEEEKIITTNESAIQKLKDQGIIERDC